MSAEQPTGGRWIPNFDPTRIVNNAWGMLTFNFFDCNHGKVKFLLARLRHREHEPDAADAARWIVLLTKRQIDPHMKRLLRLLRGSASSLLMFAMIAAAWVDPCIGQQTTAYGWMPTGKLNEARSGHTATLLPNGQVLVVGGESNVLDGNGYSTHLDSAELYDPISGKWRVTGHLHHPRSGHSATLLRDGRVLVVGGNHTAGLEDMDPEPATAEIFDPQTAAWTMTRNTRALGLPADSKLLADGRVLVTGNSLMGSNVVSVNVYDPAADSWTSSSFNFVGYGSAAKILADGRILVAGGSSPGPYWLTWDPVRSAAALYDPLAGTVTVTGSLNDRRAWPVSSLLPGGEVLVAGGYVVDEVNGVPPTTVKSTERYDPASGSWARTGDLNTAREAATASLLPNGDVLVAGGYNWVATDGPYQLNVLSSAELYNASNGQWQLAGNLIAARVGHTATLLPDGRVLIVGGNIPASRPNAYGLFTPTQLATAELYEATPPGTIGPGYTGSWFDPSQSGHGLFVQVLPDNQFLAAWFTFNPAGTEQSWFIGTGTYSGTTATVTSVVQPTGGRWIPNFDPSRVVNNAWGSLTFTFADCNHGKVDFNSTAGYGTGSMNSDPVDATRRSGVSMMFWQKSQRRGARCRRMPVHWPTRRTLDLPARDSFGRMRRFARRLRPIMVSIPPTFSFD